MDVESEHSALASPPVAMLAIVTVGGNDALYKALAIANCMNFGDNALS